MSTRVCKWCSQPEASHSIWDVYICDDCLQKMADRMDVNIPSVEYVGDCWRVRCPVCKDPGPGAETPAEARRLALVEEFMVKDGVLVCKMCLEQTNEHGWTACIAVVDDRAELIRVRGRYGLLRGQIARAVELWKLQCLRWAAEDGRQPEEAAPLLYQIFELFDSIAKEVENEYRAQAN